MSKHEENRHIDDVEIRDDEDKTEERRTHSNMRRLNQVKARWEIEKFDKKTMLFEEFADRFERRAERFIDNEEERIMLLEAALPPYIQDDLWDLLKQDMKMNEILGELCELHGSMNAREVQRQMVWINQEPRETVVEFYSRWKTLSRRAIRYDMKVSETMALQTFMSKLRDADKVEMMGPDTIEQAVAIARRVEKKTVERRGLIDSDTVGHRMKTTSVTHAISLKCFNCGSDQHKVRQCSEPRDENKIKKQYENFKKSKFRKRANAIHEVVTGVKLGCECKTHKNSSLMFTTLKAEGLSKKVIDITGLLDSGSEVNILREDIAEAIKVEYCKNGGVLRAANGTVLQSQVGYVNIWSNKIGNFETIKFYISREIEAEAIWGLDLMRRFDLITCLEQDADIKQYRHEAASGGASSYDLSAGARHLL